MTIKICKCGGKGTALEGQKACREYFEIRCCLCGRQTAKHLTAEGAVKDWNFMMSDDDPEELTETEEQG